MIQAVESPRRGPRQPLASLTSPGQLQAASISSVHGSEIASDKPGGGHSILSPLRLVASQRARTSDDDAKVASASVIHSPGRVAHAALLHEQDIGEGRGIFGDMLETSLRVNEEETSIPGKSGASGMDSNVRATSSTQDFTNSERHSASHSNNKRKRRVSDKQPQPSEQRRQSSQKQIDFVLGITELIDAARTALKNPTFLPKPWQLEAVYRMLAGSDGIVAAGTGAGKSMVWLLAALAARTANFLVITPLKAIQEEQVS
ncbi:hypothetical protein CF319_g7059 [Tilletia indica]|nr:hypothetical protein CF319_g7059 [Tilletia indica]